MNGTSQKNNLRIYVGYSFKLNHGVIPACDVTTLDALKNLIEKTRDVEGIVAYKCGKRLQSRYGLPTLVKTVSKNTNLPMIFDAQKEGNDVEFTEKDFISDYAKDGVGMLIIFPFSGPRVQATCIKACYDNGIVPIGGFRLTQKGFDENEDTVLNDIFPELGERGYTGYIASDAEERALELYALTDVKYYIGPGNKPDELRDMKETLQSHDVNPTFCMPGIGRQLGDIPTAFEVVKGCKGAYGIIGSKIYNADDIIEAAKRFCEQALKFE